MSVIVGAVIMRTVAAQAKADPVGWVSGVIAVSVARAVVVVVAIAAVATVAAVAEVVVMGSVVVMVLTDGADDRQSSQKQTGEDEFC